jgi:hypothetical protein
MSHLAPHHVHDLWFALRAALAHTAQAHWRALRAMAPRPEPRLVAAESVATAATSLLQSPELWDGLTILGIAAELGEAHRLGALLRHCPLELAQLATLKRRVDTLEAACHAWCTEAYVSKNRSQPVGGMRQRRQPPSTEPQCG